MPMDTEAFEGYNNRNIVQSPPRQINDSLSVPSGAALVVNILLLVPDTPTIQDTPHSFGAQQFGPPDSWFPMPQTPVQCIHGVLTNNGFRIAATSSQQYLYSRVNSTTKHLHVLVLPYGKNDRYPKIEEYSQQSSEVIILLESHGMPNGLVAISHVKNIGNNPDNTWQFITDKTPSFNHVTLDHATLNPASRPVFFIEELRQVSKGGGICNDLSLVSESLQQYVLEWTLRPVSRHVTQNIYICFKFEPDDLLALDDYAFATLGALGLRRFFIDTYVAHGSVLVYLRCPSYIPWYILVRKYKIFYALEYLGLTEIYQCFLSHVDVSIQRPGNEEFVDELTLLKEQMISDDVPEQPTPSRFIVKKIDLLLQDPEDLKETCETLEQLVIENKKTANKLEQDNSELQKQLSVRAQEEDLMRQEIGLLRNEIEQLQRNDEELKKQLSKYMIEESNYMHQTSELTTRNDKLVHEKNELTDQIKQSRQEINSLEQAKELLVESNRNLIVSTQQMQQRLNDAMIEESERIYQISQFADQNKRFENEIEQLKRQNNVLTKDLESLQKELKQKIEASKSGSAFNIPNSELTKGAPIQHGRSAAKVTLKGETIVVKQIYPNVPAEEAAREIQSLMQLRHKQLVLVQGAAKDELQHYSPISLVMEYMKQGSLEDLLFGEKKKLDQKTVLTLAIDITKGLRYLHNQPSMHCNLKCSNVLLHRKKSRAKISEYGLAKLNLKPSFDSSSVSYAAPEILVGGAPTPAADIYSLGAILFAMVTNQNLIGKTQEQERVNNINSLVTDPQLKQLIIDCVATDLTKRPKLDMCLALLQKMKKK